MSDIILKESVYDTILGKIDKIPLMYEGYPSEDIIKERYVKDDYDKTDAVRLVAYFEYLLLHEPETPEIKNSQRYVSDYLKQHLKVVQPKNRKKGKQE